MQEVADLAVVGGGAAGLACAVTASRLGLKVTVIERTDRCGSKLAVTGGGKGNFTHAEPPRTMAGRFDCDARFIMPLLRKFPYQRIIQFFSSLGVEARTDDDGCVWRCNLQRNPRIQSFHALAHGIRVREPMQVVPD